MVPGEFQFSHGIWMDMGGAITSYNSGYQVIHLELEVFQVAGYHLLNHGLCSRRGFFYFPGSPPGNQVDYSAVIFFEAFQQIQEENIGNTLWYTNRAMENHHFQWVNPL